MRQTATALCLAAYVSSLFAGKPPGYDPLERVVPQVKSVVQGKLVSRRRSLTGRGHVLMATVKVEKHLAGQGLARDPFVCEYVEFRIVSERVYHSNYSGSGVEFEAKPGKSYLFLLASPGSAKCMSPSMTSRSTTTACG